MNFTECLYDIRIQELCTYAKAGRSSYLARNWKVWVKNWRVSSLVPIAIVAPRAAAKAASRRMKSKMANPLFKPPPPDDPITPFMAPNLPLGCDFGSWM